MTRPLRIEYPDAWYHVMNRGRRGDNIFEDDEDYQVFIALLQEASKMFDLRVSAYCLLPNHYHLLVQTPRANLSRAMRHINGVYTQRYNRRKKMSGQLFRGRYKSILVEGDCYLLELLRYIHRNPVRAHLCNGVGEHRWSSHKGYIYSSKKWNWLHKHFLLNMFDSGQSTAIKQYKDFVQCEDSDVINDFFGKKNISSLFGSQDFINWIKVTYQQFQNHDEIPQSRALAPTIADIKKIVCQNYGVEEQQLATTRRGQINLPRNVAVYLARKRCGLGLAEIGKEFKIKKYSSVSSIVTRTEKLLSQTKELRKQIEKMDNALSMSQAKI